MVRATIRQQAAENATETAGREVGPRDKPRPFSRLTVCLCALEDRQLAASRANSSPENTIQYMRLQEVRQQGTRSKEGAKHRNAPHHTGTAYRFVLLCLP